MTEIKQESFGYLSDGREAMLFTLTNSQGVSVAFTNYGAAMVRWMMPDRKGALGDIVLGYDSVREYESHDRCAGATCGRVAARLADGEFYLDGIHYETAKNENKKHTLHGGFCGFDRKLWEVEEDKEQIRFIYSSADGEEGFPGRLTVQITYSLNEDNEVNIVYDAESDQDTIVNLTNHIYFNLEGHACGSVSQHQVQLFADYYAPCDGTPMPDGQILTVQNTPMDLRQPVKIGKLMESGFHQISVLQGFNHDFILNKRERGSFELGGIIWEKNSGRKMEIYTTKPSIHFFTANNLTRRKGKDHAIYDIHGGFCMEPGFLPNSMKFLHFPSPILRKGERYQHRTRFKCSITE